MDLPDLASTIPPPTVHPRPATTFLDVLRELDVRALDTLYDCFDTGCLGPVRLSCRALRQALDGSMREVHITVTPALARRWKPGQQSPVTRCPRCTTVNVKLAVNADDEEEEDDGDASELAEFMALSLAGMDAAAGRCIASLTLNTRPWCEMGGTSEPGMTILLPAFLCRLQSLRRLDVRFVVDMCLSPVRQAAMYDLLAATCPQLGCLILPCFAAVEGIEALRGSLEELVTEGWGESLSSLSHCAVASISQLSRLQRLHLHPKDLHIEDEGAEGGSLGAGRRMLQLLDSLPPSLECLCLDTEPGACGQGKPPGICVELRDGRIEAMKLGHTSLPQLDALAAVLLASVALPPQLPLLRCELCVIHEGITRSLTENQYLRHLLARCGRVMFVTLGADWAEPAEAFLQSMRLLGQPERLRFGACFVIRLGAAGRKGAAREQRSLSGLPSTPAPPASPTGEDVMRTAVERMWSNSAAVAAALGVGCSGSSSTAPPAGGGDGGGGVGRADLGSLAYPRVLLRGSLIRTLGAEPAVLTAWLTHLVSHAAKGDNGIVAAGAVDGAAQVNPALLWIEHGGQSYQSVPAASAVVVCCGMHCDPWAFAEAARAAAIAREAAATAVMAAAAAAVEGVAVAATESAAGAATEAAARVAAGAVVTAAAAVEAAGGPAGDGGLAVAVCYATTSLGLRTGWDILSLVVEQVVQELWDDWERCGLSEGERLGRLLELREQLRPLRAPATRW